MMTCQTAIIGAVVGSIVAMPSLLGTVELWNVLYIADIVILIPVVLILLCLPESPG